MWGFPSLESIAQDLRYASRLLGRSPLFTAVAIMSLGIGIGSAAAVFSLADAVLFRKLPVANPDELMILRWWSPPSAPTPARSLSGNWTVGERGQFSTSFSHPTFEALRKQAPANVQVFAFAGYMPLNLAIDGAPETGEGQAVSGNYFATLGLVPAAGRLLTDADDQVAAEPAAVISYAFWQQRFAGSSGSAVRPADPGNADPGISAKGKPDGSPRDDAWTRHAGTVRNRTLRPVGRRGVASNPRDRPANGARRRTHTRAMDGDPAIAAGRRGRTAVGDSSRARRHPRDDGTRVRHCAV